MAGHRTLQWMHKVSSSSKIPEPPKTFEEFLKSQYLDCWPREISFEDDDGWTCAMKKIKEDISFTSIYTHLWNNIPRVFDAITDMKSRLDECSRLLQDHASRLFECDTMIHNMSPCEKLERYKKFLKKYHKEKKIVLSNEMETEKSIEGCNFSGFNGNQLTELPRHLDAKRIYLFILKARNLEERVFRIWKTHFLSEASVALLHDSFWWWFLHKFKHDKRSQACLFDRISESYVTLFMSIPLSQKDAFFQVYPDCLAQAVYATFQEAFPESSRLFNDEFKEDLGNNICLWMSGLKPQKGFWVHWKLRDLSASTIHGSRREPSRARPESVLSSQERISETINFNMAKILKNPRAYVTSTLKEESYSSGLTAKAWSHSISMGPEFYRALFNLGGHSPLIIHYLKKHELPGISKHHRQIKIPFTRILREPSPGPTYYDVIKVARRQSASNQRKFSVTIQRTNEEIKLLKQQQGQIDKELERLQAKATKKPFEVKKEFEKFLNKLHSEAQIEREFVTSTATTSSTTVSTDYDKSEEEQEGKPESHSTQD